MKLVVLTALIAVCGAAKLDRAYLPPASARTAGGAAEDLLTPLGRQSQETVPKGGFTNDFQGVVVDAVAAGTRSSDPNDSGLGAPRQTYGSQDSKVGSAAFRLASQGAGNHEEQEDLVKGSADAFRTNTRFGTPSTQIPNNHASAASFASHGANFANQQNTNFGSSHERSQAAQDRSANTLRFESEVGPESFNYAFETDNGISAEETAVATNGVQAQGAFSYTGDDGQVYSVTYTADEGGYQPKGEHLPTPPPIPEEILKSLEQNARDEAAGLIDDGSYDAKKYNEGSDYTESSGDNSQYQHGKAQQHGNKSPFSSANAFSRQSSGSQTFATASSGQGFNVGSRHGQNSQDNLDKIQGQVDGNSFDGQSLNSKTQVPGSQSLTHNQYTSHGFNNNKGTQNLQSSQGFTRQPFDQSNSGTVQATSFSAQGQNGDSQSFSHSSFGHENSQHFNNQRNKIINEQATVNVEGTSQQQIGSQGFNRNTFGQNSGIRTETNSFVGQMPSGDKQDLSQTSFTQENRNNQYHNNEFNNKLSNQDQGTHIQQSTTQGFTKQPFGQNSDSRTQASSTSVQNGNRQIFSQASFAQANAYGSTSVPSTDTGIIKNQFISQQFNQQSRFGQPQNMGNNILGGNRHGYLPPVGQNQPHGANYQQSFAQTMSTKQPQQHSQFGQFNKNNNGAQFNTDSSEQFNTQGFQSTKKPQFGGASAEYHASINGAVMQQNTHSSLNSETTKFEQSTPSSPSRFGNSFAESTATFGVNKPTTDAKDVHQSFNLNNNFPLQSQLHKGQSLGSNSQRLTPINNQPSAFGTATLGSQQNSGILNSRFNNPSTENSVNYHSSTNLNQQNSQFGSSSIAPQGSFESFAHASAQFGNQPANNKNEFLQQKFSSNNQFNSEQNSGQFGQKQFNVNGQSSNAVMSSTESASSTTKEESYQYTQPSKTFNSPVTTQFDSSTQLNKQSQFNRQPQFSRHPQFGSTPSFQANPTQQSLGNRFSSSASTISGQQSQFSQQFKNQSPFFQAQPHTVAQASAQYQSNKQSQGFQKQTTAIPQQFQPLRQSQQATASAQFNTASSSSFGPSNPNEPTVPTQQYNGEIYEYNKPEQSLPAPNQKDQDGSPTQISSQSSFNSVNQNFRGSQSQLTGSSVSGKGEIFGGPRKPPSFDEHSGYHY